MQNTYPNEKFELYNGYITILYILTEAKEWDRIIDFCDGYVNGWEDATE